MNRIITLAIVLVATASVAGPQKRPANNVVAVSDDADKQAQKAKAALAADADYVAATNVAALIQAWDLSKITDTKTKAALEALRTLLAQSAKGAAKEKAIEDEKDKAKATGARAAADSGKSK